MLMQTRTKIASVAVALVLITVGIGCDQATDQAATEATTGMTPKRPNILLIIGDDMGFSDVGAKIGTGPRAVTDAEKGKVSTSIAVYTALLWAYDLLEPMNELASPANDEEGLSLSLSKDRARARAKEGLDNDF